MLINGANTVMNPIKDATDSTPPDRKTPATPPISARGKFTMTRAASRVNPKARYRRKAMPRTTASPRRLRSHPASAGLCQLVDHPSCAMT
jgi:hypothetical protein